MTFQGLNAQSKLHDDSAEAARQIGRAVDVDREQAQPDHDDLVRSCPRCLRAAHRGQSDSCRARPIDLSCPMCCWSGAAGLDGAGADWFDDGDRMPQPATRLAIVGRWRNVAAEEARRHPLYGSSGIMVSLLVGMLLNVPVRALEYLAAMPALGGRVPEWLSTLHFAMTLDVVLLSSLYTIAFVAALRRVPLFPRLLVAIWAIDIAMQLGIASCGCGNRRTAADVATALHTLLDGNVKKVLISVCLWLPYLLMSKRVNVTYRHRVEA